ncbi:MAG: arginine repressor [Candidatus Aminicenantales bacterium]
MNKDTKTQRQQALRSIILEKGIGDQQELVEALAKKGFATTQATISRDLQEMGFVKIRLGPGQSKYELLDKASEQIIWDRLRVLFHNFVVAIKSTKNLVLIKTSPGNANGVASLIDGLARPEILGTVAGDDTILVVLDSERNRAKVETLLRRLF